MSRKPVLSDSFRVAFLWLCVVSATAPLWAQQQIQGLPQASPRAVVAQTVGITDITVDYHRPQVKGRKIFGFLVPYGAVWRAGANENTTIDFQHSVRVEGQELAAGTYGLHMIPAEETWTVVFSNTSWAWGSFSYDESEDALRVEVKPRQAAHQEALEYRFDELSDDGVTLVLRWAELEVPVRIEVPVHEHVLTKIRHDLRSLPRFSWMGWMGAAEYCATHNLNHEEALQWIDRSLSMEEHFQNLNVKARLLHQVGREDEARKITEQVMSVATELEVNRLAYQSLARGEIEEALALFEKNVKDYPDSWNVYDSLAEALVVQGEVQKAILTYEKALSMAPEDQHPRIKTILAGLKE